MDIKELAELVKRMRQAQNNYFASRTAGRLNESKALEARVDKEIAAILTDQPENQLNMFSTNEKTNQKTTTDR